MVEYLIETKNMYVFWKYVAFAFLFLFSPLSLVLLISFFQHIFLDGASFIEVLPVFVGFIIIFMVAIGPLLRLSFNKKGSDSFSRAAFSSDAVFSINNKSNVVEEIINFSSIKQIIILGHKMFFLKFDSDIDLFNSIVKNNRSVYVRPNQTDLDVGNASFSIVNFALILKRLQDSGLTFFPVYFQNNSLDTFVSIVENLGFIKSSNSTVISFKKS